jgi:hypothetical protein
MKCKHLAHRFQMLLNLHTEETYNDDLYNDELHFIVTKLTKQDSKLIRQISHRIFYLTDRLPIFIMFFEKLKFIGKRASKVVFNKIVHYILMNDIRMSIEISDHDQLKFIRSVLSDPRLSPRIYMPFFRVALFNLSFYIALIHNPRTKRRYLKFAIDVVTGFAPTDIDLFTSALAMNQKVDPLDVSRLIIFSTVNV